MDNSKNRRNKNKNKAKSQNNGLDEGNILNMLNQVNQMLMSNPNMAKTIGECVNNIFENKDLMDSLVNEIKSNVNEEDYIKVPVPEETNNQTLESNDSVDSVDALE